MWSQTPIAMRCEAHAISNHGDLLIVSTYTFFSSIFGQTASLNHGLHVYRRTQVWLALPATTVQWSHGLPMLPWHLPLARTGDKCHDMSSYTVIIYCGCPSGRKHNTPVNSNVRRSSRNSKFWIILGPAWPHCLLYMHKSVSYKQRSTWFLYCIQRFSLIGHCLETPL